MASFLQALLAVQEPLFSNGLRQLERATGGVGVDTRLIADVTHRGHAIMRQLGLTPSDTTGKELYFSLNASVTHGNALGLLATDDYVLVTIGRDVISFNLIDVIENAHHGLPYEQRSLSHGRRSLRGEIVQRYLDHARTDERVTREIATTAGLIQLTDTWYTGSRQPQVKQIEQDKNMQPHILAVGDIITDAFIKLSKDHAQETTDDQGYQRLTFELGAKLPYDGVDIVEAVECSPNAAVSMTRLGINTSLMSWLGDDEPGRGMINYLKQQNVGTDELVVEQGMKSNYHYVLRYGADRTKLQRFEDYSYQWKAPENKPDWLYLGVLGEKTWPLHEAMLDYLEQNPDIKLAFQPGMYHLMWGAEKLAAFYKRAEIVIMNREEAAEVTGKDRGNVAELIRALHDLGVTVAVVTDGPSGAYASDGSRVLSMPNYPDPAAPYDRTGAGDAFASTIVAALAQGESLETALTWAPINSMSVVQKLGAQAGLLRRDEIQQFLNSAPDDYHVSELN